jgi:hypothetical protein
LPLQLPFTCLHCPGGCAPAADEVARNPTGKAAVSATTAVQIFFLIRLPPSVAVRPDYPLLAPDMQTRN